MAMITASSLGNADFRNDYRIKYAYLAGAMYRAIASKELVVALGKAGLMGFLGTGGLRLDDIEAAILQIQAELGVDGVYGMNLLADLERPEREEATVDLYLRHGVRHVEAAAYMRVTPALVRYRLRGASIGADGRAVARHHVVAKVSRPEVASQFMQPAPPALVQQLVAAGRLDAREAELAPQLPLAGDICVEADSGGHTDRGVAYVLIPAMQSLRDELMTRHRYAKRIRIGAAGGIGTPQAAAAAFVMGADFIVTGSINQCTREAGTSDVVKALLQELDVQDTAYAPAGDMFELGAKVQVARRGLFFAARASRLHELYQQHASLDEIDPAMRSQIEQKFFRRGFDEIWDETRRHYASSRPDQIAEIERSPKKKMAAVFRWYFAHSTQLALSGDDTRLTDFQVHCGPALGAFNRWVRGTPLESWQNRHVADLAERIMQGTAAWLEARLASMADSGGQRPSLQLQRQ
ncbi:PfaD family polyunsaturated fatty acid/polyketide biosynthesis protein [Burkholderia gladioli]|jgi:trans-AT polyketide synthase/acyltransferase/oxidoreductase domain-containing protein|uniref:[Acyl-carrier-protein] S-malonyltransferase-like inserted helical domain-containing protein n=2 Tax=Burkholderia gladioli TaxID=28095 RepID=A0A4D8TUT6_BURGA|nr:PfaD family polyunsaturated fatty acid/polyketide biosynthesis protein [Burkholderia gladioli]KAF1059886.1 Polyketide biosynthesis protein BaeE [Burkholderia gladioli]SKB24628.1 unnamed protein product [Burkholderia gladioli]SQA90635.1 protein BatK [Burkholderia gladioli]